VTFEIHVNRRIGRVRVHELVIRRMLIPRLRMERGRAERAEIGAWDSVLGDIELRFKRGNCGGHERCECHLSSELAT
jgi:hypothetical protein